jgi:hypothetical protein
VLKGKEVGRLKVLQVSGDGRLRPLEAWSTESLYGQGVERLKVL